MHRWFVCACVCARAPRSGEPTPPLTEERQLPAGLAHTAWGGNTLPGSVPPGEVQTTPLQVSRILEPADAKRH